MPTEGGNVLKELLRTIMVRFTKRPRREKPGPTDSELYSKLYGPSARRVKAYDGPNMPKKQPCPRCGATSKRIDKGEAGAMYACRTHGKFAVLLPVQKSVTNNAQNQNLRGFRGQQIVQPLG